MQQEQAKADAIGGLIEGGVGLLGSLVGPIGG